MGFTGFTDEQFAVFELSGFADRMLAIKNRVRPQLQALGEELAPELSKFVRETLYPHVALHTRRRVNPPGDTWVAFGRNSRGYKAYVHLAVGIERDGIYAGLVLKEEADDKKLMGHHLLEKTEAARKRFSKLKGYDIHHVGEAAKVSSETLRKLGEALITKKTSDLAITRSIGRDDPRLSNPEALRALVIEILTPLVPLFHWSTPIE